MDFWTLKDFFVCGSFWCDDADERGQIELLNEPKWVQQLVLVNFAVVVRDPRVYCLE